MSIKLSSILSGINSATFFVATRIMLFASFVTQVLIGGPMDAETVFVTMSLFNTLRNPVTNQLPQAVGGGAEALVAMKRVKDLLMLEEKNDDNQQASNLPPGTICIKDYNGKWNKNVPITNLIDLNIDIKPGELVVVVGPVGAGKTCLLYALLNEIERISGQCLLSGSSSYHPQESWCFSGTIKDNILLGSRFEEKRYQKVIDVCALKRDFELFPAGDRTRIGEKGYKLSGGQKARLTLARAVYNQADIYLLDDPLSAVDPAVGNHIFNKCISDFLKDKTVVLVTHQLQFLRKADKIFVLNEGRNIATGTYDQLVASGIDFLSLLTSQESEKERKESIISLKSLTEEEIAEEKARQAVQEEASKRQADHGEEKKRGGVKAAVYWAYFRAGANPVVIVLAAIVAVAAQVTGTNCE